MDKGKDKGLELKERERGNIIINEGETRRLIEMNVSMNVKVKNGSVQQT